MSAKLWEESGVQERSRTYQTAVEILVPELKGQMALLEYIQTDLRSRGFTQLNSLSTHFPAGGTITNMGIQFIRFVLHPDDRPF
jgi:hypothetical protein